MIPSQTSLTSLREQIASRLAVVRRALLGHFLAEGVARTLVVTVGLLLLSLGLDWWLDLSLAARIIYWGVVLASAAGLLFWFVVRPWRLPLGPIDVAAALDQKRTGPPLASQVASVIQLVDSNPDQLGESTAMREQAVRASYATLEGIDFRSALNTKHLWTAIAVAVGSLLVPAGIAVAFPSTAQLWAERWLTGSDRPWPRSTRLEVIGVRNGVLQVPRGEVVALRVKVTDDKAPTQTVRLRQYPQEGPTQNLTLEKFAEGDFRLELPPQQQTSRVELWGGDGRAEPFQIVPVDRPRIVKMVLTARGPRDTEPKTYDFTSGESAVRLLPQTKVHFQFETNVECDQIAVETTSKTVGQFVHASPKEHAVDWLHTEPVSLRLVLTSRESGLESHPISVSIGELPDRAPRLSVRHSGVRLRVTPAATIPFTVSVRDDFGVAGAALSLEVPSPKSPARDPETDPKDTPPVDAAKPEEKPAEEKPTEEKPAEEKPAEKPAEATDPKPADPTKAKPTPAAEPAPVNSPAVPSIKRTEPLYPAMTADGPEPLPVPLLPSIDREHRLDLASLKLEPGQSLIVFGTAVDDCVLGPQSTQSAPVIFRIVSDKELFKEILLRQQQLRVRLRKARDQADAIATKLKFDTSSDEAQATTRQHLVVTREVGQVTQGLEATKIEMELNKLGGEEAIQLIEQIILKPLRSLADNDLPAQRASLEGLITAPGEGVEEILAAQQKIVADMDKILKNMSQWDSFIDIVNQVDEVIRVETRVRDRTEELKKATPPEKKKEPNSIFDN